VGALVDGHAQLHDWKRNKLSASFVISPQKLASCCYGVLPVLVNESKVQVSCYVMTAYLKRKKKKKKTAVKVAGGFATKKSCVSRSY